MALAFASEDDCSSAVVFSTSIWCLGRVELVIVFVVVVDLSMLIIFAEEGRAHAHYQRRGPCLLFNQEGYFSLPQTIQPDAQDAEFAMECARTRATLLSQRRHHVHIC